MNDSWAQSSSPQTEFYIEVEVYLSHQATNALKKPPARKKADKRDSKGLSISTDDSPRKVKEKSSWLNLTRESNAEEHWSPATFRLTEEGETAVLNVYLGDTKLFQRVSLHYMSHTDIRTADRSLFLRDDCLGIHCAPFSQQRWTAIPTTEPLYFTFPSTESLNIWLVLLRSYSKPELYGKSGDGGLYRIWRQVELTCVQGRGIGPARIGDIFESKPALEEPQESDGADVDLFCEIFLNSILSGRTVVKQSAGDPVWHEDFVFSDLPKLERLTIVLWRERFPKPTRMGIVQIVLANFRRGDIVDGWFPIVHAASGNAHLQVGQIRLRIRIEENLILPRSAYAKALDVLDSRRSLDWIQDFESKLVIKQLSGSLIAMAVAKGTILDELCELADQEVASHTLSQNTLFRSNSALTKTAEAVMAWYGKTFLEDSLGPPIRHICANNIAVETDLPLTGNKPSKEAERATENLVFLCQGVWDHIYAARGNCPEEIRRFLNHIRELVESRYPDRQEFSLQSVVAFVFLRFLTPAILNPHVRGLCSGLPSPPVGKSLVAIAKTLQAMANMNTQKDRNTPSSLKAFIEANHKEMVEYVRVVSTPGRWASSESSEDLGNRQHAIRALNRRKRKMPPLHAESLSHPPYMDYARHLANITSTLLRHKYVPSLSQDVPPSPLDELFVRCAEIEQEALWRVSHVLSPGDRDAAPFASDLSDEGITPYLRLRRPTTAPAVSDRSASREASETSSHNTTAHNRGSSHPQGKAGGEAALDAGGSKPGSKGLLLRTHSRSISTDSISAVHPPSSSHLPSPVDAQIIDDGSKWKKSFLRTILTRK